MPQQQQQQQQPQSAGVQQNPQDQLLGDAAGAAGRDVDNTNNNINVEDSRFDVPTEPSSSNNNNNGPNGANKVAEVLYQDGGASNGAGAGLLNASDIFSTTSSIDLDMKLR